jgi:hypothetical protein
MEPHYSGNIQSKLLDRISDILPKSISLVGELSEILKLSSDSAYRRIRGETELSICEVQTLCEHFNLSFDSLISSDKHLVNFQYDPYDRSAESFSKYFESLNSDLSRIVSSDVEHKQITYLGDNLPILHYFNSPTLGPFKLFYWFNIMTDKRENVKFNSQEVPENLKSIGKEIYLNYMKTPSTEVWSDSTIMGVIEQIQFYWNTGMIESREQALRICEELSELIQLIEHHAEHGRKYYEVDGVRKEGGEYRFYYSEIEFENTTIHVEVGDFTSVYLGHLSHRYIKTVNKKYTETIKAWFENIMKKSNLLSASSETLRYQFFRRCQEKISSLRQHIEG